MRAYVGNGWAGAVGIVLLLAICAAQADAPSYRKDADTGIESWELRTRGVRLYLAQILPDQARGFYAARGFDAAAIELLATRHCVFQAIFQNESGATAVRYRLNDWRVQHAAGVARLKLVEHWQPEWERRGVAPAARLAFRWALLPTEHRYEIGDWNMGMIFIALPLGSRFDLQFVWHRADRREQSWLRGIHCAVEQPDPR